MQNILSLRCSKGFKDQGKSLRRPSGVFVSLIMFLRNSWLCNIFLHEGLKVQEPLLPSFTIIHQSSDVRYDLAFGQTRELQVSAQRRPKLLQAL